MGLFGSKEERECKKARKRCERERKRRERQCRRASKCRRTPYVVVEEYAGCCCPDNCCRPNGCVDCFDPCPRYRVCRTRNSSSACCTTRCPPNRQCCPPSMMGRMCCSDPFDPCTQFNNIIASFPPGTDFSNLLAALPSILGPTSLPQLPAIAPGGACDVNAIMPLVNSLDPTQMAAIFEAVKTNPDLYNSLNLGSINLFNSLNSFNSFLTPAIC